MGRDETMSEIYFIRVNCEEKYTCYGNFYKSGYYSLISGKHPDWPTLNIAHNGDLGYYQVGIL